MRRQSSVAVVVVLSFSALWIEGPTVAAQVIPSPLELAGSGSPESPVDELLVVSANLQEAFDDADVRDTKDIAGFSGRLLRQVPYKPDVLLLQEVRLSSRGS